MGHSPQVRELAFQVWYGCGMVDDKASAALEKEHDYIIARQTIAQWREKYAWADRAAKIDAVKQESADRALSFEEELLQELTEQRDRYKEYFSALDNSEKSAAMLQAFTQAMHGYASVVKQIQALRKEINAGQSKAKKPGRKGLQKDEAESIKRDILGIGNE